VATAGVIAALALRGGTSTEAPPGPSGTPASDASPQRPSAALPASDAAQAAQLVASARAAASSGDFTRARALLAQAYALDPGPATLLELGRVDFRTGRCRDARRAAQRVIEEASGSLADDARILLGEIGRCD
jgi:thioredoxin-like negative regulator of GroEL